MIASTLVGDEVAEVLELAGGIGVAMADGELMRPRRRRAACALIEQIISSRQPLPVSVFDTPMWYSPPSPPLAPADDAPPPVQPAITAVTAKPATSVLLRFK